MEGIAMPTQLMKQLVKEIRRLNENMEAQNRPEPEFVGADDAARLVGLKVTRSGYHRNRLTAAYKRGLMPRSIPGRPFMFHREEMIELGRKRAAGEVVL